MGRWWWWWSVSASSWIMVRLPVLLLPTLPITMTRAYVVCRSYSDAARRPYVSGTTGGCGCGGGGTKRRKRNSITTIPTAGQHRHRYMFRQCPHQRMAVATTSQSLSRDESNPTDEWKGASYSSSSSSFASHVLVSPDESPIALVNVVDQVLTRLRSQSSQDSDQSEVAPRVTRVAAASSTTTAASTTAAAVTDLSAAALIALGSVWFLPASAPRDPASGVKPTRVINADLLVYTGDYLRIHHDPRRFPIVHEYDWTMATSTLQKNTATTTPTTATTTTTTTLQQQQQRPGVVVAANAVKGWLVVNKPAGVPVHMTVDNAQENVAACLYQAAAQQQQHPPNMSLATNPIYVATPQRLDQNTSGLLVVATSKVFAAYFARLLRLKTARLLFESSNQTESAATEYVSVTKSGTNTNSRGGVHKLYRCLVCLLPPDTTDDRDSSASGSTSYHWSAHSAAAELQSYVTHDRVMRHYLEPSIRAPKRFVLEIPDSVQVNSTVVAAQWAESLLRIRKVSSLYALAGNDAAEQLAQSLRRSSRVPELCQAVLELEIELLTGRTHQIRGQLAACRYPLVGDVQYGGAEQQPPELNRDPASPTDLGVVQTQHEQLALQCCALEFLDPDESIGSDGEIGLAPSDRWNRFHIDQTWWTPLLERYTTQMQTVSPEHATTSPQDDTLPVVIPAYSTAQPSNSLPRPELLPPRVSLSPGKHKYILLRAVHPTTPATVEWFVKSAAPHECGGPYHGNVAQDLREWVTALGYDVTIAGGGRIDYRIEAERSRDHVRVYGSSYGFGRGDHEKAAAIITVWSKGKIVATVDNSPDLY